MPSNLTLAPTKPYKSSRLALPPSPFSPLTPLTIPPIQNASLAPSSSSSFSQSLKLPPPPYEPLAWLWQCHLCNRVYRLGTTRRCLEDGHYFCSGTTTVKRSRRHAGKKTVRHKACASEFDYAGWKGWGVWRRDVLRRVEKAEEEKERSEREEMPRPLFAPKVPGEGHWLKARWARKGTGNANGRGPDLSEKKDCWGTCDYPSECRWGKQYGVETPTVASFPETVQAEQPQVEPKTNFDDILLNMPALSRTSSSSASSSTSLSSASSDDSEIDIAMQSPPLSPILPDSPEEPTRKPSFDDLLESVKRRKRRSCGGLVEVPSPLASHPPSPTTISMVAAMDSATYSNNASDSTSTLFAESASEHIEDVAAPATTRTQGQGHESEVTGQTALQRAFDDFDLEFRRSFERAGAALTGFVSAVRSTAALEEEKAEGFVGSLSRREREGSRRRGTSGR